MTFGTHCDTSLAIADALINRRAVTFLRLSTGEKLGTAHTMNYRPAMAKCRSWVA